MPSMRGSEEANCVEPEGRRSVPSLKNNLSENVSCDDHVLTTGNRALLTGDQDAVNKTATLYGLGAGASAGAEAALHPSETWGVSNDKSAGCCDSSAS